MRYFRFSPIIGFIILPPILYLSTLSVLEHYFQNKFTREIEAIYLGDTDKLLIGEIGLKQAVNQNIKRYLQNQWVSDKGVIVSILITTKLGELIYPDPAASMGNDPLAPISRLQVGRENFDIFHQGILTQFDVTIKHNSFISNAILAIFLSFSLILLYRYWQSASLQQQNEVHRRQLEMEALISEQELQEQKFNSLKKEKQNLVENLDALRSELKNRERAATRTEEDLFDEIESLEQKIASKKEIEMAQQKEMDALRDKIEQVEKITQQAKKKKNKVATAQIKRFSTLYKNVTVHDRAIDGFLNLTDELKLKSEELIHQLNEDYQKVSIKRKVFGKKNRQTVFEVIFAYKGRLYFRPIADNNIEILAIGTKNTQGRELEFLNSL